MNVAYLAHTCNYKVRILVRCKFRAAFLVRYVQLPTDSDDSDVGCMNFRLSVNPGQLASCSCRYAERGMQARDINLAAMMQRLLPALSRSLNAEIIFLPFSPQPHPFSEPFVRSGGVSGVFLPFNFPAISNHTHYHSTL